MRDEALSLETAPTQHSQGGGGAAGGQAKGRAKAKPALPPSVCHVSIGDSQCDEHSSLVMLLFHGDIG